MKRTDTKTLAALVMTEAEAADGESTLLKKPNNCDDRFTKNKTKRNIYKH